MGKWCWNGRKERGVWLWIQNGENESCLLWESRETHVQSSELLNVKACDTQAYN